MKTARMGFKENQFLNLPQMSQLKKIVIIKGRAKSTEDTVKQSVQYKYNMLESLVGNSLTQPEKN